MAEEAAWQVVALIPKGIGDYHGIGLACVVWKVVKVILNRRFTSSIAFHKVLHDFRAGHGTDTASLGAKMLQKVTYMREEVFCEIFVGLHKAYDALDRDRFLDILDIMDIMDSMEILEGYLVGPQDCCVLVTY